MILITTLFLVGCQSTKNIKIEKEEAALSNPATEHLTSQIQEEDCDSCTI